jgi:hypothetical protein
MDTTPEEFFNMIDYELLKKQKNILYRNMMDGAIPAEDVIELEGLISLIDYIEDMKRAIEKS